MKSERMAPGGQDLWAQDRGIQLLEQTRAVTQTIKKAPFTDKVAAMAGEVAQTPLWRTTIFFPLGGEVKAVAAAFLQAPAMDSVFRTTPVGGYLLNDWVNTSFDGPTDLLSKLRWSTTINRRTCLVCAVLDGKTCPVNDHPQGRCMLVTDIFPPS